VFSFHPVKIITSAEGGMALCNDVKLAENLRALRSHGITRNETEMTEPSHGPWYYQQIELGYNYRMTDLQAALGLSQLDRLAQFVHQRIAATELYQTLIKDLPVELPAPARDGVSAWHLYIIRLQQPQLRRRVFEQLRAAGIGVNVHYIPIHTQPYYQQLGFQWGQYPQAEQYYSQIISLPLFAGITTAQQQQVVTALRQALESA
jgi:dTDP-4-amino-4,6-dideoxygalactose transaminase